MIVKTDLNLTEVKRFDKLPKLAAINPECLAYHKNFIYCSIVLQTEKCNIIKLTTDLELVELIPFKQEVCRMKIASNGVACIELPDEGVCGFYDTQKGFSPLVSFRSVCDGMSLWNDEFYVTASVDVDGGYVTPGEITLKCYRNTGELKNTKKIERVSKALFVDLSLNFDGCLVSAFHNLVAFHT